MFKKTLVFLLVLSVLWCATPTPVLVNASVSNPNIAVDRSVISSELLAKMSTAAETDLIPISLWLEELDRASVDLAVYESTGQNRSTTELLGTTDQTGQAIYSSVQTRRLTYSQLRRTASETFLRSTAKSGASVLLPEERITFISSYAPMILAKATVQEILNLAQQSQVCAIYYAPDEELSFAFQDISTLAADQLTAIPSMSVSSAFSQVRAAYVRDELGFDGEGVKIGMIDGGIPYLLSCFEGANIIADPYVTNGDIHASIVASILVSQDADNPGLVPEAQLYCTSCTYRDEIYQRIEWLLEQGVSVINMSGGFEDHLGEYDPFDRWIDHIAIEHSVHFIVAAGNKHDNNTQSQVASPAMAYNVITVGASNMLMTDIADLSCYVESSQYAEKPDILAPGDNIRFDIFTEIAGLEEPLVLDGTSLAAPIVTGIVAQILTACPSLADKQDAMKAILTANIHSTTLSYTTESEDQALYEKCGAGLVDARSALSAARSGRFINRAFAANTSNLYKTYTFTVLESDTINRVSLTWLKYAYEIEGAEGSSSAAALANLDIEVYDPNNQCVASAWTLPGNVEVVDFEPMIAGTYTIRVYLTGSSENTVYFGLSWW